ncbi:ABC transporter permease [Sphingomonas azotifigens]|uniref:ABC transporter permease n=1 Tax=Sphingomonas azotifigens TaxID=330920 RepID=UPI0009FFA991|nr:ABC transporter permease [Sphingomonas azotifigens]
MMPRFLRQALTIARRDLTATVMTPTFLLFLLSPLLMIGFGVIGGLSGQAVSTAGEARQQIVAIAPRAEHGGLRTADRELRSVFTRDSARPRLRLDMPDADPARQARALFDSDAIEVAAVLYGPLDHPTVLRRSGDEAEGRYLAALAAQRLRAEHAPGIRSTPRFETVAADAPTISGRGQAAYFSTFAIFLVTLMLSGQAVGAMAEERSNKVIEILAAAVPLESVFFGKLLGAFGSALIFVAFWGTLVANLPRLLPGDAAGVLTSLSVAVGPIFPLLLVGYFVMAYLLQSAVFLGVGSLASTQREIQMLSLPITIFQFAMFGMASYAAGNPESWVAIAAEIVPFSSPMAMAARAANAPELWPHALAFVWQALWVAGTLTIAARLFRRGVLKSGSPKRAKKASA